MNGKITKNLLIRATSLFGVVGASVLLSLPVLAQGASRADTPGTSNTQQRLEPNSADANQNTNSADMADMDEDTNPSGEYTRDVGGSRYTDRSTNLSDSNISQTNANQDFNRGNQNIINQSSRQDTNTGSMQEPAGQSRYNDRSASPSQNQGNTNRDVNRDMNRDAINPSTSQNTERSINSNSQQMQQRDNSQIRESLQNPSPDSSDGSATRGDGAQRDQRNPDIQTPNRSSQAPDTTTPQQTTPDQTAPRANPGVNQQTNPSVDQQQQPSGVDNTTTDQPSGAGTGTVPGLW